MLAGLPYRVIGVARCTGAPRLDARPRVGVARFAHLRRRLLDAMYRSRAGAMRAAIDTPFQSFSRVANVLVSYATRSTDGATAGREFCGFGQQFE
jgi:hypothetical protein